MIVDRKVLFRRLVLASTVLFLAVSVQNTSRADYEAAVLADNPVGYWRMNEPDGDTAVNIGSGDLDGDYFGGERVPQGPFTLVDGRQASLGANNLAFQVGEDIDEYMSVPDSILSDLGEFTLTGWVNPSIRGANRIGLFGQNDAIEFGFINPNQIQLWTPSGQVLNYGIDPVDEIPEDTWFHIGAVGTGLGLELYINGEQVANTFTGSYGTSTFNFNIAGGGVYDPTGNQYTGVVDEVAIWDHELSEEQIAGHVQAAKTAGGDYAQTVLADGPMGYWGLNETDATAVNSGTRGDALNGTYTGGTQGVPGPDETYPGFAAGNTAFEVEAPDDGYVGVDDSPLSNLSEFTLSGWIKPGFIEDNRVGLWGQNDAMEFGFINPTTIQMWTPQGGALNFDIFDEVVEDEWVHVAAVGDGDEIRLYIDGEEVAFGGTPIGGNPVDSYGASDFLFNVGGGGIYDGSGNQFTGLLDEVAFWDTALSASQIKVQFESALEAGGLEGDYNDDGNLDALDIDLQAAEMKKPVAEQDLAKFDHNGDGVVDLGAAGPDESGWGDRLIWIRTLRGTSVGDVNFDNVFDSGDLVLALQGTKYGSGEMAGWIEGDWNGDMVFDSGDLVLAFQDGQYVAAASPAAVPEPSAIVLMLLGTILLVKGRRR